MDPSRHSGVIAPLILAVALIQPTVRAEQESATPLRDLLDLEQHIQFTVDSAYEPSAFDYVRAYVTASGEVILSGILQTDEQEKAILAALRSRFPADSFPVREQIAIHPIAPDEGDVLVQAVLDNPAWPTALGAEEETGQPPAGPPPERLFTREPWILGWTPTISSRLFAEQRFASDVARISSDLGVGAPYSAQAQHSAAATWRDPGAATAAVYVYSSSRDVKISIGNTEHHKSIQCRESCTEKQGVTVFQQSSTVYVLLEDDAGAKPLDLRLGAGTGITVRTHSGAISFSGVPAYAKLISESGGIAVKTPRDAVHLDIALAEHPQELSAPEGFSMIANEAADRTPFALRLEPGADWVQRPEHRQWYGELEIRGHSLANVELEELPLELGSSIVPNWFGPSAFGFAQFPGAPGSDEPLVPKYVQTRPEPARLTFSALDRKGMAFRRLSKGAVRISVDGKPQRVTKLRPQTSPKHVIVAFELPEPGADHTPTVREAVDTLLRFIPSDTQVEVFGLHGAYAVQLSSRLVGRGLARAIHPYTGAADSSPNFPLDEIATLLAISQSRASAGARPDAIIYIGAAGAGSRRGDAVQAEDYTARDDLLALAERNTPPLFLVQTDVVPESQQPDPFWFDLATISGGDAHTLAADADAVLLAAILVDEIFSGFYLEFEPTPEVAIPGTHLIDIQLKKKDSFVFYKQAFEIPKPRTTNVR